MGKVLMEFIIINLKCAEIWWTPAVLHHHFLITTVKFVSNPKSFISKSICIFLTSFHLSCPTQYYAPVTSLLGSSQSPNPYTFAHTAFLYWANSFSNALNNTLRGYPAQFLTHSRNALLEQADRIKCTHFVYTLINESIKCGNYIVCIWFSDYITASKTWENPINMIQ